MVFFAIWWAWVNYSWFASAYDTDDIIFRLLTFVVMTGRPGARRRGTSRGGAGAQLLGRRHRLPDHAGRDDPALAAGGARARRGPSYGAALRRSRRLHPAAVGAPDDLPGPRHRRLGLVRRPGRARDGRHRGGPRGREPRRGTGTTSPSATSCSRSSCSARSSWRPPRRSRVPSTATASTPAAPAHRGSAADGVLDVVDLLQAADGRLAPARDLVRVRLRARLRVRQHRGRRRLPRDPGRPRRGQGPHRPADRRAPARRGGQHLPAGDRRAARPGRHRAAQRPPGGARRGGALGGRAARARARHQRAARRPGPRDQPGRPRAAYEPRAALSA